MAKWAKEERLQALYVKHLDFERPGTLYTHPPNGGKRALGTAIKFKLMGVRAGAPDLFIFEPRDKYVGMVMEFKIGKNVLSESQLYWMEQLRDRGWFTCTAYTIEEALKWDKYYFNAEWIK